MATGKRVVTSQKKRDRIIQTTTHLLLNKGSSSATSTTDICSAARLARPTLYHHFGSKRNLLLSVHLDHIEKTLKPYLAEARTIVDPLERLRFMIVTFMKEIICKHPELRVLIHDSLTINDKSFREVRGVWKEHYTLLRETIGELQSGSNTEAPVGPSMAALFVLGMLTWVLYWFDYERKGDVDRMADEALHFVLRGLNFSDCAAKRGA